MKTIITDNLDSVKCFQENIVNFYRTIGFTDEEKFIIRASKDDKQIILEGTVSSEIILTECQKKVIDGESAGDYIPVGATHYDGAAYLRRLGADGYDVFCYPNHLSGGLGNRHSTRLTSIFYEIDDLPLDEQEQVLFRLAVDTELIPSAVVFSGSKSLHTYFAAEDLSQEQWLTLMRLLTIRQNSDPAICNVGRAMRLPGVPRVQNGETKEVSLYELNFAAPRYTYTELFTSLGGDKLPYGLDDDRWRRWRAAKSPAEKIQALHAAPPIPVVTYAPRTDLAGVSGRVSIFDLIPQSLISSEGQGNRNNRAFNVANHALATESWALSVPGLYLDGDARQVFDSFCQSCSPPLSTREAEKVWKSASKSHKPLDTRAVEIKERIVGKLMGARAVTPLTASTLPQITVQPVTVGGQEKKKRDLPRPQITPTSITTGQYLPDVPTKGVTAIKAGFGAGKTRLLEQLTAQSEDAENLLVGSRITLIRQTVERIKGTGYQDIPSGRAITPACVSSGTLAICVNSLMRLEGNQSDGEFKNIWLDETVGVLNSLLFDSTLKDDRLPILKKFEALLAGSGNVLLMDGNLTDAEVSLISALAPHLPVSTHQHKFTDRQPIKIKVNNGTDGDGRHRRDAWKNQLATIYRALADGKRVAVVGDSADRLQAIGEDLAALLGETLDRGHSPSIRFISGSTSGEQWAQDFLEAPDNQLDGVRVVLLSPAAVSGVSIMSHFDVQVGIFSGIPISASDVSQMIGRFRKVGEREVIIPAFVNGVEYPAYDPAAEERRMMQGWHDEARRVGTNENTLPSINPAWIRYAAYREWLNKSEKHQLADAVAWYLRENGYEPEFVLCDAGVGDTELERIRDLKESIKLREAEAVAKATPLTSKEYDALKGGNTTIENQRRLLRYEFEKSYPDLSITSRLAYIYLYERIGEALTIAALLSLPIEGLQPVMARQYLQILRSRREDFPWLTNHTAARFGVIRELLLLEGEEVKSGDPILAIAGEVAKKQEKYLGLSLFRMSDIQAVQTVLKCGGYTMQMTRRTKDARYYAIEKKPPIEASLWDGMLDATIRRITEQVAKWNEKQALQPMTPPPVEVAASEKTVTAETTEKMTPLPYIDLNREAVTVHTPFVMDIPSDDATTDSAAVVSIPVPPVTPHQAPLPPVSLPSVTSKLTQWAQNEKQTEENQPLPLSAKCIEKRIE